MKQSFPALSGMRFKAAGMKSLLPWAAELARGSVAICACLAAGACKAQGATGRAPAKIASPSLACMRLNIFGACEGGATV